LKLEKVLQLLITSHNRNCVLPILVMPKYLRTLLQLSSIPAAFHLLNNTVPHTVFIFGMVLNGMETEFQIVNFKQGTDPRVSSIGGFENDEDRYRAYLQH